MQLDPSPKGVTQKRWHFESLLHPVNYLFHTWLYKNLEFIEIQRELEGLLLFSVSISTICKFLYENGFTRQRLRNVALQQDVFLREQFMSDVSVYCSDMFVCR